MKRNERPSDALSWSEIEHRLNRLGFAPSRTNSKLLARTRTQLAKVLAHVACGGEPDKAAKQAMRDVRRLIAQIDEIRAELGHAPIFVRTRYERIAASLEEDEVESAAE